ncbi:uncharacterized protein LOC134540228 isoform X2 [Bacillus rossius redtenbacheri]
MGYNFLGSSMLARLGRYIETSQGFSVRIETNKRGKQKYYECTGGATVKSCVEKLKKNRSSLTAVRVLLMVGLNDILKGTRSDHTARDFRILLRMLKERQCHVVVMLLPPVPRFHPSSREERYRVWLNYKMQRMAESMNFRVLNVEAIFRTWDGSVKLEFFERFMGASRRTDNIHWNTQGMFAVMGFLRNHL